MNIFNRAKAAILLAGNSMASVVVHALRGKADGSAAPVKPEPAKAFQHFIRFRVSKGRCFGPAFDVPREHHHLSRETCRHYLRTRFFAAVSQGSPLMSRRERRRMARIFTCLEYRRMMQDPTNVVDPEMEALYRRMSEAQRQAA